MKYLELKKIINESKKIVVFTGAGISVASNIPDFRSSNGLYSEKYGNISPEELISHSFFLKNPEMFFKFYSEKMVYRTAKYNIAHKYFADLEKSKSVTIVTQNIDGLHQKAGSSNVVELHGCVERNYCMKCGKFYNLNEISLDKIPMCSCGGIIKPDVVLYEEPLDNDVMDKAIFEISSCDTLIVVGTSLMVYPAASFIRYFKGSKMVLINKSKTKMDELAYLVINDDIVNVVVELEK